MWGKEFTKREWIFIIIIVSLIQAAIWYISYIHAESKIALNYVSFAGTLISIILAVLAIGYTYGESVGQKNKGDSISNQISLLSDVVRNVSKQTESLSNISSISNELTHLANRLEDGFSQTKSEVSSVSKTLESLINENTKNQNNTSPFKLNKSEVSKNFLSARTPLFEISVLFIILISGKKYKNNSEMIDNTVNRIISAVQTDNNQVEQIENVLELFTGAVLTLIKALEGLGLIEKKLNEYTVATELVREVKGTTIKNPQQTGKLYSLIRDEILKELSI